MDPKRISKPIMTRLPRYYRYLSELYDNGQIKISSNELSKMMGVTASQVRQDLNIFGEFGLQGYGYNIAYLKSEISKVMGIDKIHNCVLVGLGNLGQAILKYSGFRSKGFIIEAIFEHNAKIVGHRVDDIPIIPIRELNDYINKNDVHIIILTVPKSSAQNILKNIECDKRMGIWNFSNTDIKLPNNFIIENVHLSESLMRLSYKIKEERL